MLFDRWKDPMAKTPARETSWAERPTPEAFSVYRKSLYEPSRLN